MSIKIVLLDLDGTLLNSNKTVSDADRAALERAAAMGVHIVPATGRFYDAMPEVVRKLPFVRYAITANGAQVYDAVQRQTLCSETLETRDGLEIYSYLETLPGMCDCYADSWGYIQRSRMGDIDEYVCVPYMIQLFKQMRTPVEDMKEFLSTHRAEKLMIFFKDLDRRALELERIRERFPHVSVTSSVPNNIEINAKGANKGDALGRLCAHLGVDIRDTISFGDGSNDLTMIRAAGIGVAMENACAELKEAADYITSSNDENGIAKALEKFVFV